MDKSIWSLYAFWRETLRSGDQVYTTSQHGLTMAETIRTTLIGSPQPDGGVPLFSRTKRHAARIPSSNWKRKKKTQKGEWQQSMSPVQSVQFNTERSHPPAHSSTSALQFDAPCHSRSVRCRSGRTPSSLLQNPWIPGHLRERKMSLNIKSISDIEYLSRWITHKPSKSNHTLLDVTLSKISKYQYVAAFMGSFLNVFVAFL